jgi:hypothetical protein
MERSMSSLKWLTAITCFAFFLDPLEAQQPKKQGEIVGIFLGDDMAPVGVVSKQVYVPCLLMKDDEGRYLIFKKSKDARITPSPKLRKNPLEPGDRIAVTLAANDPSTVLAIDIRQETKGKQEDFYWAPKMRYGRYREVKNTSLQANVLLYERTDGGLNTILLEKNARISSGLRNENLADIRPGHFLAIFTDGDPSGSKLLGIALFAQAESTDDGDMLEILRQKRVPFVRDPTSASNLTVRVPLPVGGTFAPDVAGKVMSDLGQMPSLRSLKIGLKPSRFNTRERPKEDWLNIAEDLKKLRSPFALEVLADFNVGSGLSECKNLTSLTFVNPESRVDFASLKKLASLKSLTLAVDNDADLEKAVAFGPLTGLILEADSTRKSKLTPAGMKSLKKATNLLELVVRLDSAKDALVRDAALREVKDLPKLQTLVSSVTPDTAKEIKKNAKIRSLTVWRANDSCMKDICEMKGLLDLCVADSPLLTNAGYKHLKNLRVLQRLDVDQKVTGEAMAEVSKIPSLVTLRIPYMHIDEGMVPVKNLTVLRHIYLGNISDKGIASLEALPSLEAVFAGRSRISGEGLQSLSKLKSLTYLQLPYPGSPGGYTAQDLAVFGKSRPDLKFAERTLTGPAWHPASANVDEMPSPFERPWLP